MAKKPRETPPSEPPQIEKFIQAARKLECDDDEQHFRERLGKLVKKQGADDSADAKP
jgi:hypothetical protein